MAWRFRTFAFLVVVFLGCGSAHAETFRKSLKGGQEWVFEVDDSVARKNRELIELILETESIDTFKEKKYWLDALARMSAEQVARLFEILDTERKKLKDLDEKYAEELAMISNAKEMAANTLVVPSWCRGIEGFICFSAINSPGPTEGAQQKILSQLKEGLDLGAAQRILFNSDKRSAHGQLIGYAVHMSQHVDAYSRLYKPDHVVKFINSATSVAANIGHDSEAMELAQFLKGKDPGSCAGCAATIDRAGLLSALRRLDGHEALTVLERMRGRAKSGEPWLSLALSYQVLSLASRLDNQREINHEVAKSLQALPTGEGATQYLKMLTDDGDGETELPLLDFLAFSFRNILSPEQVRIIERYVGARHQDENYYKKSSAAWYKLLNFEYFGADANSSFESELSHYPEQVKQDGGAAEGRILERGFYAALKAIKRGEYDIADRILGHIQGLGQSERSIAHNYIERHGLDYVRAYLNRVNGPSGRLREWSRAALEMASGRWGTLVVLAGTLLLSALFVFYPHAGIFRNEPARKLLFHNFNPLLFVLRPIVLWRLVRFCRFRVFMPIRMILFSGTVTARELVRRYVPMSLAGQDEHLHVVIARALLSGGMRSVLLRGEGGIGKSLTAARVAIEMQKCGYVAVLVDRRLLPETIEAEAADALVATYLPDKHVSSVLDRMGFDRYVFVIDNADSGSVASLLAPLLARYPQARIIVTSRSHEAAEGMDFVYDVTATTLSFERFLDDISDRKARERIGLLKTFILGIRNTMLITILLEMGEDIGDLVKLGSSADVENAILEKYIAQQLKTVAARFYGGTNVANVVYVLREALGAIAAVAEANMLRAHDVVKCIAALKDSKDAFKAKSIERLLSVHGEAGEVGVMEVLEGASLLVMADKARVRFAHDRIYEYLKEVADVPEPELAGRVELTVEAAPA